MHEIIPHDGFADARYDTLRTEDVKFSPSGNLLAIVSKDIIILSRIDTASSPVRILKSIEIFSPSLTCAHGIDFVREDIMVVANREGWVTFYKVPAFETWTASTTMDCIHELESAWFGEKGTRRKSGTRVVRCGPGAVRVRNGHLFTGTNNVNTVTRHALHLDGDTIATGDECLAAQDGLEIPDGVSTSRDGRFMAVSNLHYGNVVIYDLASLTIRCRLSDADLHHPHGLCFSASGDSLYVADAGNRYVHWFATGDDWLTSIQASAQKVAAVEPWAFDLTKAETPEDVRYLEGGMKGIDLDPTGRIIATTCRHQTLRFFESFSEAPGLVRERASPAYAAD